MILATLMAAAQAVASPPAAAPDIEMTVPGPQGPLAGSLLRPAGAPHAAVIIVPGSGPTDRNGDNRMGVAGGVYRQLAQGLAARGIASLRIDKRGMFGSRAAITDPNHVTIADYAADTRAWAAALRQRLHLSCVWLAGHSEGGLVVLAAAQQPGGICGIVLISTPGRPLGTVMRQQFAANPANAPILPAANATLDALEEGRTIDPATLPAPLQPLFNAAVQPYLIDLLRQRPTDLAAHYHGPTAIVQGRCDLQVGVADAEALSAAHPRARLALLAGVNHVLKPIAGCDLQTNVASYGNPALPIAPAVIDAVAGAISPDHRPPAPPR